MCFTSMLVQNTISNCIRLSKWYICIVCLVLIDKGAVKIHRGDINACLPKIY